MNLLDPNTFHRLVSRRMCFFLINAVAIGVLLFHNQLRTDFDSIFGCVFALTILNVGAYLSARKYKDWK